MTCLLYTSPRLHVRMENYARLAMQEDEWYNNLSDAVSYTHLDVYKRQRKTCLSGDTIWYSRFFQILRIGMRIFKS